MFDLSYKIEVLKSGVVLLYKWYKPHWYTRGRWKQVAECFDKRSAEALMSNMIDGKTVVTTEHYDRTGRSYSIW